MDSECSVVISGLSEEECFTKSAVTVGPSPTTESSSLTPVIIIGTVVIIIALIAAITITIITFLMLRNHRSVYTLKTSANR